MTFRHATPDDAENVLAFWRRGCASMSVTDEVEYLRRAIGNPAGVLLLATIDGEIVGSLLGTFDGWRGNMYRLVVSPAHRRQGIATKLVRRIEAMFAERGVRRITALVEADRPVASAFWTAVGYPRDLHIVRHVGVLDYERDLS